jgi:hypothetical protein
MPPPGRNGFLEFAAIVSPAIAGLQTGVPSSRYIISMRKDTQTFFNKRIFSVIGAIFLDNPFLNRHT